MTQKFFLCKHCGNITSLIRDCGVPIYCCGEEMKEIKPGTTEASGEKHIPVYDIDGKSVTVRVGKAEHPMIQEHYIEWICIETNNGVQYRMLQPDGKPIAHFTLQDDDKIEAVYAFCNQHSLWKR